MFQDSFQAWQQATADFVTLVKAIPEPLQRLSGICGIWSSKELIAHFAGWNREALRRFQAYQKGDLNNIEYDEDTFNAQSVAALKLFNWRETWDTYQATCEDLTHFAQSLTPAEVEADRRYRIWFKGLTKDLRAHSEEARTWLTTQGVE